MVRQVVKNIPCVFWNPKTYYRVYVIIPLVPILSEMNQGHALPSSSLKIHFYIIIPKNGFCDLKFILDNYMTNVCVCVCVCVCGVCVGVCVWCVCGVCGVCVWCVWVWCVVCVGVVFVWVGVVCVCVGGCGVCRVCVCVVCVWVCVWCV
jgi:hypothetical protein